MVYRILSTYIHRYTCRRLFPSRGGFEQDQLPWFASPLTFAHHLRKGAGLRTDIFNTLHFPLGLVIFNGESIFQHAICGSSSYLFYHGIPVIRKSFIADDISLNSSNILSRVSCSRDSNARLSRQIYGSPVVAPSRISHRKHSESQSVRSVKSNFMQGLEFFLL